MVAGTSNNVKQFYNSSDLYFAICENRNEADFKNVLDVIRQYVPPNATLLEFGCGTGQLASLVAQMGHKTLGVDISGRFISYANEIYKDSPNLQFRLVDFSQLPFADHSFDCIYTSAVLEHCYEVDKIIADFHRLLKPGGLLVIGTPNMLSPFTRLSLIGKWMAGKRQRFHLYGTPAFFLRSVWLNIKKALVKKPALVYVIPKYTGFTESDEDVTYLSTHRDYLQLLKPFSYKILELARGASKGGKIIAKFFPKLSGEVLIVALKRAWLALFGYLADFLEVTLCFGLEI